MRRASSLALAVCLAATTARADDAGVSLQTSFRFEVRVGPSIVIAYDDDLSKPVRVGLPVDFAGWRCTRAPVFDEKGSKVGGYTCLDPNGYTLKLAVVWCSATWVDKQSTTATILAPSTSVSFATACETKPAASR